MLQKKTLRAKAQSTPSKYLFNFIAACIVIFNVEVLKHLIFYTMFTVPALDTFITCEVLSNPVTLFLAPFIKPNKRLSLNQKKKKLFHFLMT